MGIPTSPLLPGYSVGPTKQRSEEERDGAEHIDSQHERHPPLSQKNPLGSGKPRYGLPDAPLDVVRLSPLVYYEDRDPLSFLPFS
jgi:hypothetical protein